MMTVKGILKQNGSIRGLVENVLVCHDGVSISKTGMLWCVPLNDKLLEFGIII